MFFPTYLDWFKEAKSFLDAYQRQKQQEEDEKHESERAQVSHFIH